MNAHNAEKDAPTDEAVTALSEALYGADLEEILGVPDEALDDIARVVLSLGYVLPPDAEKDAVPHGPDNPCEPKCHGWGIGCPCNPRSAEKDACPKCWGDGYIDHDLGREVCDCAAAHRPNGCCDYHRHIADGCCHCERVFPPGRDH